MRTKERMTAAPTLPPIDRTTCRQGESCPLVAAIRKALDQLDPPRLPDKTERRTTSKRKEYLRHA